MFDIEPLNPVVKGHRIVIPREHVTAFPDNPHVSAEAMLYAAHRAKEIGDCNLITSKGKAATQSVFHLHIHIVPRQANDGLALPWNTHSLITEAEARGREAAIEDLKKGTWADENGLWQFSDTHLKDAAR